MDDMQRQMDLFEEGGIADDGMEVDPVSGNEIPPGSMASEVRDDIPAQLSEGEYVVPADVLRYYGVRFFEDLRTEAKQGMTQMEEDGRIGGDPVPAGGPQEGSLTPEEMAVLEEMGMSVGGYVPQQQPPQAVGNTAQQNMPTAYAEGGLEDGVDRSNITSPAFTQQSLQDQFGLGFSLFGPGSSTADTSSNFTTAVLYSPDGMVRSLTLPTEQSEYDKLISEGWTTSQTDVTTETSVGKEEREDRGGGLDENDNTPTGPSISEMNAEELGEAAKGLQALNTFGGVMTAFSPGIGVVVSVLSKTQQNAINNRAKELGIESPTVTDDESFLSGLVTNVSNLFKGKNKTKTPTTTPTTTPTKTPTKTPTTTTSSLAPTTSSRPQARPGSGTTGRSGGGNAVGVDGPAQGANAGGNAPGVSASPSSNGVSAGAASSDAAGSGHEGNADPDAGGSMLNKGGFVSRRSKKKKK